MDRIRFEGVSKRYALGERRTAREALVAAARGLVGCNGPPEQELWSLRDVSFAVPDGEALGIIGRNGAGKSTILKILSGITAPTSGVSWTRGRIAALLEVGTGFHQELTGRENIYLNGAILGMTRRDIGRAFDGIVEFSGVERFLDTPVKRYSSGMYLRLAFAVAAHLEPDVLVVDEILAVGDAEFQRKCLGRMAEAERDGRTVVFVSHDLDTLTRLCRRALWLETGQVRAQGPAPDLVRSYLASGLTSTTDGVGLLRGGPVTVRDVRVRGAVAGQPGVLLRDDPLRIEVDLTVHEEIPGLDVAVYLTNGRGVRALDQALSDGELPRLAAGDHVACLDVPPVLNVGDYAVGLWIGTAQAALLEEPAATSFTLHGSDRGRPDRVLVTDFPLTVVPPRRPPDGTPAP